MFVIPCVFIRWAGRVGCFFFCIAPYFDTFVVRSFGRFEDTYSNMPVVLLLLDNVLTFRCFLHHLRRMKENSEQ